MAIDIEKSPESDLATVAEILGSAFEDDPTFSWVFRDASTRRRRLERLFKFMGHHLTAPHDATWITGDGNAVAAWIPPDKWKTPMGTQLRMLPGILRYAGTSTPRLMGMLNKMEKVHPHDPPSWYLLGLGTRKEYQGKGLGSALMVDMLRRCDAEGLPAYLESSNPRNIPFYARHGFEERAPVDLGKDGPVVTPMWREPRPPQG